MQISSHSQWNCFTMVGSSPSRSSIRDWTFYPLPLQPGASSYPLTPHTKSFEKHERRPSFRVCERENPPSLPTCLRTSSANYTTSPSFVFNQTVVDECCMFHGKLYLTRSQTSTARKSVALPGFLRLPRTLLRYIEKFKPKGYETTAVVCFSS
uniref:Uncharacterized protein n=1 Tax=Physcomitrium patens TaxID=3218 RepID=A0A2K1JVA9_PHYPA|nr:hypothetical protein PHYPA_015234 [Physcomitrium patens]